MWAEAKVRLDELVRVMHGSWEKEEPTISQCFKQLVGSKRVFRRHCCRRTAVTHLQVSESKAEPSRDGRSWSMAGTRPAIAHTHRSHQVMGAVECQLVCLGRRSPHCRQLCSPRRWKSTGCRASQSWPQSASYRRVFVWLLLDCRDLCVWSMNERLSCLQCEGGPA